MESLKRGAKLDLGLQERVAIIAASKGLGRAVAEGLAREGASVASERASYINGASIAVDGGLVRSLF